MALTPQEYQIILDKAAIGLNIYNKVSQLNNLLAIARNRGNPADPYNDQETWAHLLGLYGGSYNQLKADLIALVNTL